MKRLGQRIWNEARRDIGRVWRAGVVHIGVSQWISQFVFVAQRILLARILKADGIGHISVVSATLNLVRLPAGGGIFTALTKLMAESARDPAKERPVMGTALTINLATSLVISVATAFILGRTNWVPDPVANGILRRMVPFLPVLILAESFRCALLGQRRMRAAGAVMTTAAVLSLVLVTLAAWWGNLPGWTAAQIASFFIALFCAMIPLRSVLSVQWNSAIARRLAGIGVFAFLGQMTGQLIMQFDTLAVSGLLKNPETTGIYNTAALVAQQLLVVPGSILTVAFPMVAQSRGDPDRLRRNYVEISRKLWVVSIGVSLAAAVAAYPLFGLMGARFLQSLRPFRVLLLGFVARALYTLDNTYLDALGRTDLTFASGLFAAVTTIGLNLWLIPRWGLMGAAWATTLAMFISLALRRATVYLFIFRWRAVR